MESSPDSEEGFIILLFRLQYLYAQYHRYRPKVKKRTEENFVKPTFILKPKQQRVDVNDDVKFHCSFVACPKPDVIWFFNDHKIQV